MANPKFINCCGADFSIFVLLISIVIAYAAVTSSLVLCLLSFRQVDLEVIALSGSIWNRLYAEEILTLVKKRNLLHCTLIICNLVVAEAFPTFLGDLVTWWSTVLVSMALILLFGEIIPRSARSRYGLKIGAKVVPTVRVLLLICWPFAFPISKLVDWGLGHPKTDLFSRAELKAFIKMHGDEANKGGQLTRMETRVIAGVLGLFEKTAWDAMTPVAETFSLKLDSELNWGTMALIMRKGYSRIPLYFEKPDQIVGLVQVRDLCMRTFDDLHAGKKGHPSLNQTFQGFPRFEADMPLYSVMNHLEEYNTHVGLVVKHSQGSSNGHEECIGIITMGGIIEELLKMNCFHTMLRAVKPELFANEDKIDNEVKWAKVYVQNDTDSCEVHVLSWLQEWDDTVHDAAEYTMPRYSNDELQELKVGCLWWLVTHPQNEHRDEVMSMLSDFNKSKRRR
ncbi:DUF21 domain-containing protein At2g14520-like [Neltuma alba]|uniref:DUF21 domain-containing protein At2g14520-like n=1 Tax=Neltuma alba TaxID=207710 RepID=UPI0010A4BB69|nr:DUF21 domain-containing protein At2g14520-like [Prosopis alba]